MRAFSGVTAAFLLLTASVPALAQEGGYAPAEMYAPPPPAPYGYPYSPDGDSGLPYTAGLRGSLAFAGNRNTTVPNPSTPMAVGTDTGYGGSVYLGARLGYGLRLEGELLYRHSPLGSFSLANVATPAWGYADTIAPMLNLLWDWPVTDFPFRPFMGAGIGAAYSQVSVHDRTYATSYLRKSNWNFAYSLIGGAEMPLSQTSRLTAMYRWMKIDDAGFKCGTGGAATYGCLSSFTNQSVDLGLEMDL